MKKDVCRLEQVQRGAPGRLGTEAVFWEQAGLRGDGFSPGEEAALGGQSNNPQNHADGLRT